MKNVNLYQGLPTDLGLIEVELQEMMFYQYLPIKLIGQDSFSYESRLNGLEKIIHTCSADFIKEFDYREFIQSNVYLTVKYLYQTKNNSFNREGYHTDGFMTNDINYIWSDKFPTIFNSGVFYLTLDDKLSMKEMTNQAKVEGEVTFQNSHLLRLSQQHVHKVGPITEEGMRTFVKLSFSKDRYDLIGNAHNYELSYDWDMRERAVQRNIPNLPSDKL